MLEEAEEISRGDTDKFIKINYSKSRNATDCLKRYFIIIKNINKKKLILFK